MPEYRKIKGTPRKETLSMEDIVPMYIKAMKLGTGLNIQRVFAAWDEVSGVKDFTLRKFYRDGKLYVTLSSSMVRSHLEFQKDAVLQAVNEFLKKDRLFAKDCEKAGYVKEIILK